MYAFSGVLVHQVAKRLLFLATANSQLPIVFIREVAKHLAITATEDGDAFPPGFGVS